MSVCFAISDLILITFCKGIFFLIKTFRNLEETFSLIFNILSKVFILCNFCLFGRHGQMLSESCVSLKADFFDHLVFGLKLKAVLYKTKVPGCQFKVGRHSQSIPQ